MNTYGRKDPVEEGEIFINQYDGKTLIKKWSMFDDACRGCLYHGDADGCMAAPNCGAACHFEEVDD